MGCAIAVWQAAWQVNSSTCSSLHHLQYLAGLQYLEKAATNIGFVLSVHKCCQLIWGRCRQDISSCAGGVLPTLVQQTHLAQTLVQQTHFAQTLVQQVLVLHTLGLQTLAPLDPCAANCCAAHPCVANP